jgi:protein SCO1
MDRRAYLGALCASGVTGLAGCLGDLPVVDDDSETALDPPEQSRGEPNHPIHGETFPTFSLPDPHEETNISLADFEDERAYLLTFIFTTCPDECPTLVRLLSLVQEDAAEQGYSDDIALLAMTFDPERDDADSLLEYGQQHGADVDADNWHFLRPETNDEAMTLLNEEIGAPAALAEVRDSHDDHDDHADDHDDHADDHDDHADDHDDHADDHDDHADDHDDNAGDDVHYYIAFLVNDQGIVERSYPNITDGRDEVRPRAIIDDARAVVE